jgi:8-oxo-dGTP diphosphatase
VTDPETERARMRLAADLIVIRTIEGQPHALLTTVGGGPYHGMQAFPGGHVEAYERIVDAALRELAEETGLKAQPIDMVFLAYYDAPHRDIRDRVLSFTFMVDADRLFERDQAEPIAGSDATALKWASVAALVEDIKFDRLLAYDHSKMILDAAAVMRTPDLWPPGPGKSLGTPARDRL